MIVPEKFIYKPLYPQKWDSHNKEMYAWEGDKIVLATIHNKLDKVIMTNFISKLEDGGKLYSDLMSKIPEPSDSDFKNKVVIAALNDPKLTCGHGCGVIANNGIEVCGFYANDYSQFQSNNKMFSHYYFYEMGRNYYLFQK